MTLFEHMTLAARAGLSEVDRERERALGFEARWGGSPELDVYVQGLAVERAQQLLILDGLRELRTLRHPAVLLEVRSTRMAKATLRSMPALRTGTGR